MNFLTKRLDNLALDWLRRRDQRVLTLAPQDNVLLIRDNTLVPLFATVQGNNAGVGAAFLAALHKVGNDATGQLDLETAIVGVLSKAGVEPTLIQAYQDSFLQERLRQHVAATSDETDGEVIQ